jgi:hypothetical protein
VTNQIDTSDFTLDTRNGEKKKTNITPQKCEQDDHEQQQTCRRQNSHNNIKKLTESQNQNQRKTNQKKNQNQNRLQSHRQLQKTI